MSGSNGMLNIAGVLGAVQTLKRNDLLMQRDAQLAQRQDLEWQRYDQARSLAPAAMSGDREALGQLAAVDPDRALQFRSAFERMDDRQRQQAMQNAAWTGQQAQAILSLPPEQRQSAYAQARQQAAAMGINDLPEAYPGDAAVQQAARSAMTVAQQLQIQQNQIVPASMPMGGGFAARMIGLESGGQADARNPRSSATGAGQFIDSTWLNLLPELRPDAANLPRDQQLALRNDPALARQAVELYAQKNLSLLERAGLPQTDANAALAHRYGPLGAIRLLRADPSQPVAEVVGPEVMAANPDLQGKTAGDAIGFYQQRFGGTQQPANGVQGTGLTPLMQGQRPFTEGLPSGYQWAQDQNGARVAMRIPGTPAPLSEQGTISTVKMADGVYALNNRTGDMMRIGDLPANEKAPAFTEGQANAALYADRMAAADQVLDQFPEGISMTDRAAGAVPLVGNFMTSSEGQQVDQAQRDFINAILRRESGAAIAASEFENAKRQYFPQPGDSQEVLAQKKRNRQIAIQGVQRAAGPAYQTGQSGPVQAPQETPSAASPRQSGTTGAIPPPPAGFQIIGE